jgi:protoheme IX farnesyltransferase
MGAELAIGVVGETRWQDWFLLLKPRVVSLVVFTGAIGLAAAPGHLHPVLAFTAILCIALAAGAAGCLNMWWERDIDALMARTAKRPIPDGRIEPGDALGFGIALAVFSVLMMGLAINLLSAVILAVSIAFYVGVYTMWLKRRTPQNIVIGGAAGAFPPVIGWVAVTGHIGVLPVLMFLMIFLWTPPHFWSLSLYACRDYARAGVPMLPVTRGARHTRVQIFIYTVLLAISSVLPWALGYAGLMYGAVACLTAGGFVWFAWRVLRDKQDAAGVSLTQDRPAKQAFRYSLMYLAVLFAALATDRIVSGAAG